MVSVNAVDVALSAAPGFIDMGKTVANAFSARQAAIAQQAAVAQEQRVAQQKATEQRRQFEAREARLARESELDRQLKARLSGGKTAPSLGAGFKPQQVQEERRGVSFRRPPTPSELQQQQIQHRVGRAMSRATTLEEMQMLREALETDPAALTPQQMQLIGLETPAPGPDALQLPPEGLSPGQQVQAAQTFLGTQAPQVSAPPVAPQLSAPSPTLVAPQTPSAPQVSPLQQRVQGLLEAGAVSPAEMPLVEQAATAVAQPEVRAQVVQEAQTVAGQLAQIAAETEHLRGMLTPEGSFRSRFPGQRPAVTPESMRQQLEQKHGRAFGPDFLPVLSPEERQALRRLDLLRKLLPSRATE